MHNNARLTPKHKPFSAYRAGWETLVLTVLCFIPLSAWVIIFTPAEHSVLFWACLAPLMLAAFHGTPHGLISLGLTILFLAIGLPMIESVLASHTTAIDHVTGGYRFTLASWGGIALWVFTVGECRRFWRKRAIAAEARLEKANQRIERFSRNYQLLKASHDQLSQSAAQTTPHVRGAMRQLKQLAASTPAPRLRHLSRAVLEIFCDFGALQCAGLYACMGDQNDTANTLTLCHNIGLQHRLDDTDPMLVKALEDGELQYVSGQFRSSQSRYQLCIPFKDSTGKIHGVIAAENIRFFALNTEHIILLAVLAHVCADLLNDEQLATVLEEHDTHIFKQKVLAYRAIAQENYLSACVVTLQTSPADQAHHLRALVGVFRDTDTLWFHHQNAANTTHQIEPAIEVQHLRPTLSVLMPMTNVQEAKRAITRVQNHLKHKNNNSAVTLNIHSLTAL